MGLNSALKDRARAFRDLPTPSRVEGRTVMSPDPEYTGWFKCRIDMSGGSKRPAAGQGAKAVEHRPTLLFGIKDVSGNSLTDDNGDCVVKAKDRVEFKSPQLGHWFYEIAQHPHPIRKKRRVIGYTAVLVRLDHQEFRRRDP